MASLYLGSVRDVPKLAELRDTVVVELDGTVLDAVGLHAGITFINIRNISLDQRSVKNSQNKRSD